MTRTRRRSVDERHADHAVLAALSGSGGVATRADVVVGTGLPEMVVERSLDRLLDRYDSSVSVRPGGVMEYRFLRGPLGFRVRGERRLVLDAFLRGVSTFLGLAWKTLRTAFRFALGMQVLVYAMIVLLPVTVIAGVVLGIAALVAGVVYAILEGELDLVELLFTPEVFAVLVVLAALGGVAYAVKVKYDLILALAGRDVEGAGGLAGFIKQVNDFATGPLSNAASRGWADGTRRVSLEDEQVVLARVRGQGGVLRAGDLVRWLGLDLDEADRQATRICVEYGGTPGAAGPEVLEFAFPSLLPTASRPVPVADRTRHEQGVDRPVLTGNTPKQDLFIAGLGLLNLVAGAAGLYEVTGIEVQSPEDAWVRLGLSVVAGWLPVGCSGLMLGMYLARVPVHVVRAWWSGRARVARDVVSSVIAHCVMAGGRPLDLDKLGAPRDVTRRVAVSLGGTFDLDSSTDPPRTVWRFPRLAAELVRPGPSPRP